MTSECIPGNLEHLLNELRRIERRLQQEVTRWREAASSPEEERFRGLFISEGEIDDIIRHPLPFSGDVVCPDQGDEAGSLVNRLGQLADMFHLSHFETDVLLTCLLPELDIRYQKLFGYLQDDITKRSPTVDLVLNLLCVSFADRLEARQAFSPEAPLMRYHLLRLIGGQGQQASPLLARLLQIEGRISDFLLGTDRMDTRLLSCAHLVFPATPIEDVPDDDTVHRLSRFVSPPGKTNPICQLLGNSGVGRSTTAAAVCARMGIPLLAIDVGRIAEAPTPPELLFSLAFREGRLQNAALYLNNYDMLPGEGREGGISQDSIIAELASYPQWVFLAGKRRWQPVNALENKPFFDIEFPDPDYPARRQLWESYCNHDTPLAADVDFADIAGKFRLTGGQIASAAATARNLALWRDPEHCIITAGDIYSACRRQSSHRLGTLAAKIESNYTWDDIVLPRDQIAELREVCGYVKHRHTVYGDWGFRRKLSRGTGLNVLFAGPSGTGKTMAAEIMANELGIDLYKIDLSAIVSKYIGETEKNLDRIFHEGKTANAILFFDEADALFGKRSEVRDSHDRYANVEIAYLLQKMEEYDGMVILATNLRKNMDEAFARRMHFSVEFPIPEELDRLRIWRGMFPTETPLAEDIDIPFMARQFRISGGNIKNIAVGAAFLAAEDGGAITTEQLIRATKREYQKIGKLCTETEFAQYFGLVKS